MFLFRFPWTPSNPLPLEKGGTSRAPLLPSQGSIRAPPQPCLYTQSAGLHWCRHPGWTSCRPRLRGWYRPWDLLCTPEPAKLCAKNITGIYGCTAEAANSTTSAASKEPRQLFLFHYSPQQFQYGCQPSDHSFAGTCSSSRIQTASHRKYNLTDVAKQT